MNLGIGLGLTATRRSGGTVSGGGGDTPPPDEDYMQTTVTITDAQFKDLANAPVELIAAVPGKVIQIVSAMVRIDSSAGLYTNISDPHGDPPEAYSGLYLLIDPDGDYDVMNNYLPLHHLLMHAKLNSLLVTSGFTDGGNLYSGVARGASDWSAWVNQPVLLTLDNGGKGALTGGDPANTLKVTVIYAVIDA